MCAKGMRIAHLRAKSQSTPVPTWKSTRDRRDHYTTLTNASTSV